MKQGKIAIVGAGMTGAYLYRLLKNRGISADLYDRKNTTACGLTPCAWGTSHGFEKLVEQAGLKPQDYLLKRFDHVMVDDVKIYAELKTFDKPRLIGDLLGDATVALTPPRLSEYERVIDATGSARALLPPVQGDLLLECKQYGLETEEPLESRVKLVGVGYAWCFPLAPGRYHIGCGSILDDPYEVLQRLGWLTGGDANCCCAGSIRVTGPQRCLPIVAGSAPEIIGIGEAAGCVAPLVGDGIIPGMRSAALLLEHWNDPQRYQRALLREFEWMADERLVVDALLEQKVGLREAMVLLKNCRRMKMQLRPLEALKLLSNLMTSYLAGPAPSP